MIRTILNRFTDAVIWEGEAETVKDAISQARKAARAIVKRVQNEGEGSCENNQISNSYFVISKLLIVTHSVRQHQYGER
jgi:hypothetical protein